MIYYLKTCFSLIMIFLFCTFVYGQDDNLHVHKDCNIVIMGKVVDGESGIPIEGAMIILENAGLDAISDSSGFYVFKGLCRGTYDFKIISLGFKELVKEIEVRKSTYQEIILHEEICELPSVLIEGKKVPETISLPQVSLSGKELEQTRGYSFGEALRNLPGVYTLQTGPAIFKPVIQGLSGNRVLIMNNGVRLEGQQWGTEHAPEIDPFNAQKITVIKGANSVKYGSDAIGGVILVEPGQLRKEPGVNGDVNLVGFSNNRMGAGAARIDFAPAFLKGFSGRIQGSFRDAGNARASDYYMRNTGFREKNISWMGQYTQKKFGLEAFYSLYDNKVGIFSGAHIGNLTDLQRAIASDRPLVLSGFSRAIESPYQQIKHELFKAAAYYKFNFGTLRADFARQFNDRSEYDRHSSDQSRPELQFDITTHTANLSLEHKPIGLFSGTVGVSGITQGNTWEGRFFIPNFRSNALGFFLLEKYKSGRLELDAGFRYDHKWITVYLREGGEVVSPEFQFGNFSGTLGSIYQLTQHWKLRANVGTAFRPPAVNEMFSYGVHHGTASFEVGDRNLVPEIAYNLQVSAEFAYERIYGEITGFNNYINNFIYLAPVFPATLTIRGAFPTFHYRQTNALISGGDLTVHDSLSRNVILSSRLSYVRGYNLDVDDYLIFMPPPRLELGMRYRVYPKSTRFLNPYVEARALMVQRQRMAPETGDYAPPPPGYVLLNFDSGVRWMVGSQPFDLGFSVHNALNTRYRDYLDRFRYYTDAMGRNFIVRLKITF